MISRQLPTQAEVELLIIIIIIIVIATTPNRTNQVLKLVFDSGFCRVFVRVR
jgi:hypothetical protein